MQDKQVLQYIHKYFKCNLSYNDKSKDGLKVKKIFYSYVFKENQRYNMKIVNFELAVHVVEISENIWNLQFATQFKC